MNKREEYIRLSKQLKDFFDKGTYTNLLKKDEDYKRIIAEIREKCDAHDAFLYELEKQPMLIARARILNIFGVEIGKEEGRDLKAVIQTRKEVKELAIQLKGLSRSVETILEGIQGRSELCNDTNHRCALDVICSDIETLNKAINTITRNYE